MGSVSRTNRCSRFRQKLEDQIVAKAPMKPGDWLEVRSVAVGMDESQEISKLYVLVKNTRTGDEEEMTFDHCLYDPESMDQDNVERLHGHLFYDQGYEEKHKANRKKIIQLLKGAELIDPDYKEKPCK
jgi:hypothetical protein